MKKLPDSESKIMATLNSLNGIQRAKPAPFFFTRLMSGMQRKNESGWERLAVFITRPLVAMTAVVLIIFVNMLAAFHEVKKNTTTDVVEQSYADYYYLNTSSLYDFENPEQ
jgi:hypothetical protein